MNIIFFGSSQYSAIDEKALHDNFGLSLVVTLPDRQNSKTKQLTPNPVKKYAREHNIPVITAEKLTPEVIAEIAEYKSDFLVVADYGLILPQALLDLPKKAAINVHHSLLPKYRGPAPVPFAILHGEKIVGVTVMLVAKKVDAGDILAQQTYTLLPTDTTDSVLTKLNQLGSQLAVNVIKDFDAYFAKRMPQDETQATFTHFMKRDDGYIDSNNQSLDRMVRAYFPWPGVWTRMKIKRPFGEGSPESGNKEVRIKILPGSPFLFQVEGKKPVSYKDFLNGYPEAKELLTKLGLFA